MHKTSRPHLVVLRQNVVHVRDVLAGDLLDDQCAVIGVEEEALSLVVSTPRRGAAGQCDLKKPEAQCGHRCEEVRSSRSVCNTYLIVQVLDPKALSEISKDLRTVFFELEMSRKVLSVKETRRERETGPTSQKKEAARLSGAYLLKRWLLTLILVFALKSSGSSMTGTGTWLRSLI